MFWLLSSNLWLLVILYICNWILCFNNVGCCLEIWFNSLVFILLYFMRNMLMVWWLEKKFWWIIFIVFFVCLFLIMVEIECFDDFCVIVMLLICVWVRELKNLVVSFLVWCILLFIRVIIVRFCCILMGLSNWFWSFNVKVFFSNWSVFGVFLFWI